MASARAAAAATIPGARAAAPSDSDRPTGNDDQHDDQHDASSLAPPLPEPPAPSAETGVRAGGAAGDDASPAPRPALGGAGAAPGLAKSDSTASAGGLSLRSHRSIPVTGTFPLGTLRVHEAAGASPSPSGGGPIAEEDEMPPLGGPLPAAAGGETEGGGAAPSSSAPPRGDVFLLLDLPDGATVGCDALAVSAGGGGGGGGGAPPRGPLGVRDLPPGPHLVWAAAPGALSRRGYWFVTRAAAAAGAVRVKQWDRYGEVLGEPASRAEARAQREGLAAAYPRLVPYGLAAEAAAVAAAATAAGGEDDGDGDDAPMWRRVTWAVTEAVLARVTGRQGVAEWAVDTADAAKGEVAAPFSAPGPPHRTAAAAAAAGELSFLFAPGDVDVLGRRDPAGVPPPAAAAGPADPATAQVVAVLDNPAAGVAEADLVGELQLAFVTGLHLSNLACLEQWWHLVLRLVLRAPGLALARPALCRALLRALHAQLAYSERYVAGPGGGEGGDGDAAPGTGILDVLPRNKPRLRAALAAYKRRLDAALLALGDGATAEQAAVGRAFLDLEAWLWRYGWDLRDGGGGGDDDDEEGGGIRRWAAEGDDSDDEYQPVVVDLDEEGREVGLLSWD